MKAGTYHVKAKGHGSSFMPMEVTIDQDRIVSVQVDAKGETKGVADEVFKRVPQAIVDGQTMNVDTVAGATISSHGVIDGVAQAIKQAGGDPAQWQTKAVNKSQAQDQELTTDVVVVGAGGAGLAAAVKTVELGHQVVVLEKFPQIGGNTTRAGGPLNAADPVWQKEFHDLPGEKETLTELMNLSVDEIDPEYQADFRQLQAQIKEYLASGADYLFDSVLLHEIQTYLGENERTLRAILFMESIH